MLRQILAVVVLSGLFVFNFRELNRRKMGPIEFVLWQTGIVLLTAVTVFQAFGQEIASFFGFELLANFVFSFLLVTLLVLARIQSRQIGKLQKQLQDVVQASALKK